MAAVNALNLPKSYPFRDPNQTPLLNDSLVQASTEEQSNKDGDEEGGDSPSMRELAKQIDSHVEVINVDNSSSNVAPEGPNDTEINLVPTPPPPTSGKASSVPFVVAQENALNRWCPNDDGFISLLSSSF